jgi:hypothetical protein
MTGPEDTPELVSYRARLALATAGERRDALADLEAELVTLEAMEEAHREVMN